MDSSILSKDRENLRHFYKTSQDYKKLLDAHDRKYLKPYVDTVNKYAKPGSMILDLGCGNGLSSYMLSKSNHRVIGTDISTFFLSQASHLQNKTLKYQVCDALDLPFVDESFDLVCSNELIEHLTDIPRAIAEMIRILKSNGILIIMGPNLCSPFWGLLDLLNMARGRNGRHTWSETRLQALKWWWHNLTLSIKKRLSSKADFIYRKPDLEKAVEGGDSDSSYYACPIDLERFLKIHNMKIISLHESSTLHGRVFATCFPRFGFYINIVARKI
jgi:ubiquinone/menaquinone biosynthesis C-methylase UbiE